MFQSPAKEKNLQVYASFLDRVETPTSSIIAIDVTYLYMQATFPNGRSGLAGVCDVLYSGWKPCLDLLIREVGATQHSRHTAAFQV